MRGRTTADLLQIGAGMYALFVFLIGGAGIYFGFKERRDEDIWNGAIVIGLGLIAFGIASIGRILIEATGDLLRSRVTDSTDKDENADAPTRD